MKNTAALAIGLILSVMMGTAGAQNSPSYKDGPVTQLSYIKIKSGHFDDYMAFLDTTYKGLMEADKKAGLVIDYKVYFAQARTPHEPDLVLAVTYKNMAALDKSDEGDTVAAKVLGPVTAQNKAAMDRDAMREVLGGELIREMILK